MRFLAGLLAAVAFSCGAADAPKAAEVRPAEAQVVVHRDLKVRDEYKRTHPLPDKCRRQKCEIDHIIPLHKGGADSTSNMQTLTHAEHAKKTAAEARARAAEKRAAKAEARRNK